jgi:DNA ligase (NAD+)
MPTLTASKFLQDLKSLNKEDLVQIKGIGEVLADNFIDFINSKRYNILLQEFSNLEQQKKGLNLEIPNFKTIKTSITGKKFVITGTFSKARNELTKILESLGAKSSKSISSQTDFLLAGQKAGLKLEKAKELNVLIIDSKEVFFEKFNIKIDF